VTGRALPARAARAPASPAHRAAFLDGLRGIAILLMVVNHTARWWLEREAAARVPIVYGSVILPAALFLFVAGFCLPLSCRRRLAARRPGPGTSPAACGPLALARLYGPRGAALVAGGVLLNVLVFPDQAPWSGGVLLTIGLSVVLVALLMPLLASPVGRVGVLGVAMGLYAVFALSYPALTAWVAGHQEVARVVFLDFPPWPWAGAALVGGVAGSWWLSARQRGPGHERRYFRAAAILGAAALVAHDVWQMLGPTSRPFGFGRDFALNQHWTPRGMTLLLIAGGVALLLAGMYWLMEVRGWRLPWLVTLGRTALMLYFVHHVIVYTVVSRGFGVRFGSWMAYAAANAVLLIVLVHLGRAWLALEGRLAWRGPARTTLAGARRP
jgi:uncharacterized membrane protein